MQELEKHKIGGEIVDYDQATIFPIISGIELLYFNKDSPVQENSTKSILKDMPSTMIVQKSSISDFCMIYRMDKHLPVYFTRYGCDIVFLINPDLLQEMDLEAFPEIWKFAQDMAEKFQLENKFCTIKLLPQMIEIFEELKQIPFPPTMFRFYMQLKVYEMLLQLSILNLYSTQVHFYPYKQINE